MLATDLQIVTITPTGAVISWVTRRPRRPGQLVPDPVPAPTQLWLGGPTGELDLVHDDDTPSAWHSVKITGLEPGRQYRFEARSGSQRATASLRPTRTNCAPETLGTFTTLVPPAGRRIATVCILNDIHIGEKRQGIVLGPLPTSVKPSAPGYPEAMTRAALDDIAIRFPGAFIGVNGDVTYSNLPDEIARARQILDGYGRKDTDWIATRGNHDHPRHSADPFGDTFWPYQRAQHVELDCGLRVLGIDTTRGSAGGFISEEQFAEIDDILSADPDRPTLSLGHHPVTRDAALSSPSGPQFMLRSQDRPRLQRLLASAPGVFCHVAGHTHRMRRDRSTIAPRVHFLEAASCAAYPCGYTAIGLYEDGFTVNFHRPELGEMSEWVMRSRWQALGIGAHLMIGSTYARNHVVAADLSGLT